MKKKIISRNFNIKYEMYVFKKANKKENEIFKNYN